MIAIFKAKSFPLGKIVANPGTLKSKGSALRINNKDLRLKGICSIVPGWLANSEWNIQARFIT